MRFLSICCAAVALTCGGNGSQRARDVVASAHDGVIDVHWSAASGATSYRVQLLDLDSGAALSDAVQTSGTTATLRADFSPRAGVAVDALPGLRAMGLVTAGATGGTAGAWQIFGPQDFRGGTLHAKFPQLAPGERLAVLLVNEGGADHAQAQVDVSGVAAAAPAAQSRALVAETPAPAPSLHERQRTYPPRIAAAEPLQPEAHRDFCVVPGLDFSRHVRKHATRVALTEHGAFYVDDEDLSHYEAPAIDALTSAYEQRVWPSGTSAFGAPTDVDANGRIIVLLSHELGTHLNGGWLIGYFGDDDLLHARDNSGDCSGGGSNHGEIVYLNDIQNGTANGWSTQDLTGNIYPATLAHEIQHLLNLGHRCVQHQCSGPEDTWINEGLSKLAEDLAGYGWNGSFGRGEGTAYLGRSDGALRGYDGRSLTKWEGDPIGNYQGAHSFMRFFADRLGADVVGMVARGAGGRDGIESALQRPLARAMAEWATALLVSNDHGFSDYSFSGAAWSPFHERLRQLDVRAPGTASLRADGIAAMVSGASAGGEAEVTVQSGEQVPPHVVVVRLP